MVKTIKFRSIIHGLLVISIIFLLIPICVYGTRFKSNNSPQESNDINTTYSDIFRLEAQATRFYVTSLNTSETWTINVIAAYKGVFYLFLFNSRPKSTYILENRSIDPEIYNNAVLYNVTPSYIFSDTINETVASVSLNYTSTNPKELMHYIEIILVLNGPDTFYIESSKMLQVYFIPFITGYPIITFCISTMSGLTILIIGFQRWKKRKP